MRAAAPVPWLFGRATDLWVFGASALVGLVFAGLAPVLAPGGEVPTWAWLVFVLAIDVAHVWATVFRTYLDREELRRRTALYTLLPVGCYALGVALYLDGPLTFWRVLAYVAVFHFVRQQAGWVAVYRARAAETGAVDRWLDTAVIYLATGWPLLYWHAHLPRRFSWFVAGDFLDGARLAPLVAPVGWLYATCLATYCLRALLRAASGATPNLGKHLVVAATALAWFVGIVANDDDFVFTATNVTIHGVPYFALLWAYTKARAEERPGTLLARVAGLGVGAFMATLLALALLEELAWDRFVWDDRPELFGLFGDAPRLGATARAFVVPLFALPQAVHYALDGLLWRRSDTGKAQARALGFAG